MDNSDLNQLGMVDDLQPQHTGYCNCWSHMRFLPEVDGRALVTDTFLFFIIYFIHLEVRQFILGFCKKPYNYIELAVFPSNVTDIYDEL